MQKRPLRPGRPTGTITHDPELAAAFGAAVRELRTARHVPQEALAHAAGIERSHMGKIERGLHVPTLVLAFRIARALGMPASVLIAATESRLGGLICANSQKS